MNGRDDYLTFQGKVLQECQTVSDYGLQKGATLFLSERNRGGCFIVSLSILSMVITDHDEFLHLWYEFGCSTVSSSIPMHIAAILLVRYVEKEF